MGFKHNSVTVCMEYPRGRFGFRKGDTLIRHSLEQLVIIITINYMDSNIHIWLLLAFSSRSRQSTQFFYIYIVIILSD